MLTSDLIRASVKGKTLSPSLIDPTKPALVKAASELLAIWDNAEEHHWRRRTLDTAIADWSGLRRDVKTVRGLAKVLQDRSSFEIQSPLPPVELRKKVFLAARAAGPLALEPGPLGRPVADDVYAAVAAELGVGPGAVKEALYADLREEERLMSCDVDDPTWLLHRYNIALVQALLLRATEVRVRLQDASVSRLRQLFRYVKFHQLMHLARRDGPWLEITLDGPGSLFKQSDRYGRELATFFPAVPLQTCAWEVQATVLWTKAKHRKTLTLTHEDGLVSHYADRGGYKTREQEAFEERWNTSERAWVCEPGSRPIELAGRGVLIPDYTFTHPDGRTAHLEIVGFWRHEALQKKLDLLANYGPGNVIVAISRKRSGSKKGATPPFDGPSIEFAQIVPTNKVIAALEAVGR